MLDVVEKFLFVRSAGIANRVVSSARRITVVASIGVPARTLWRRLWNQVRASLIQNTSRTEPQARCRLLICTAGSTKRGLEVLH